MGAISAFFVDLWNDGLVGRLIAIIFLVVPPSLILLVYVAISSAHLESEQWGKFSQEHACRKVAEMKGNVQTGVGVSVMPNGQVGTVITTDSTPDKAGYLCDDGITYWR